MKINFAKWREASFKLYPDHQYRKNEDKDLIDAAVKILQEKYQGIEPEFQHGHFSTGDLYKISNNQVVVLSNLYWSWKPPFYNAIFGYHWFIYHLSRLKNPTIKLVKEQKHLWFAEINSLAKTEKDKKLLNLALLERAAAGLNLDALSVDQQSPITEYLAKSTRENVRELVELCSSGFLPDCQ